MRLALPPIEGSNNTGRPNPALLKAVARAYQWKTQLIAGEVSDQRAIAKKTGLDEVYVGKTLRYAFLAPEIVESILEGHQPQSLTLAHLQKRLPICWAQQRIQLQF
jgi:hypothetical protein